MPLDAQFTVQPGEIASVEGTDLRLRFLRVSDDSRCPADAICIQGGDAIVHVRASGDGDARTLELHTGDLSRSAATYGAFRIALTDLQPDPFSSRPIDPAEYRATLQVTRP